MSLVIVIGLVLAAVAVPARSAAAATRVVSRTAPYDFGCAAEATMAGGPRAGSCQVRWDPARRGTIQGVLHPSVGICWFFVVPCPTLSQTNDTAGLTVRLRGPSRITASAVVADLSPVLDPVIGLQACFLLVDQRGGYDGGGCRRLPAGGRSTIRLTYDVAQEWLDVAPEDTLYLTVWLVGTGKVKVERMSYRLERPIP